MGSSLAKHRRFVAKTSEVPTYATNAQLWTEWDTYLSSLLKKSWSHCQLELPNINRQKWLVKSEGRRPIPNQKIVISNPSAGHVNTI